MRSLIRHLQPVVNNISRGRWIKGNAWKAILGDPSVTGVQYDYLTTIAAPTAGQITVDSGGLELRVHRITKDGYDIFNHLSHVTPGWVLTVGTQSAALTDYLTNVANTHFIFTVAAWPVLANGTYTTKLRPPSSISRFALSDADGDGLTDTKIADLPGGGAITIDADSINIDLDGDGAADVIIPRP